MDRSFATKVYAATYWVLVAVFGYLFVSIFLPDLDNPDTAAFLPILLIFFAIFVVAALAATAWAGARRRSWFWLVGLIPPVLFLLLNAPYLPYALTHPTDTAGFVAALPLVVATVVLVLAGWQAFREARAGAVAGSASVRASLSLAAVTAATLGALAVAVLAVGGGGGAALAAAPTTAATLVAENTKYLTTSYSMSGSDVLGLFVTNDDSFAHSFDIDSLGIHVQVPANATVAVAIKPTGPGTLEFYCAIPGHRQAGMAGTITIQ
jgi:uncharacterized cupredoxin-like copper-binding protein